MKIEHSVQSLRPREGRTLSHAFTLVELLVVVAIIAVLASILLTSLSQAKGKAQAVACLNNEKQLILATLLYVDDFDDTFPNNFGDNETKKSVAKNQYLNWVNNVMSWDLDSDNTNATLTTTGGIGPYTSGTAAIYRCPSDFSVSDYQRAAGWRQRVRSISMNAMVGDAGEFSTSGINTNNPSYKQFFKLTQIPDHSRIFVFTEEHPDSIDDGYFLNRPAAYEWHDLPASYHNGGANLAFADGHVE